MPFLRGIYVIFIKMSFITNSYKLFILMTCYFINSWTITIVKARRVQIMVFAVKGDSAIKYHVKIGKVTYEIENAINLEVHNCGVQSIICFVP